MGNGITELVEAYWEWLRRETRVRPVGAEWTEITTPHLDRHNDYLQIFARKVDGRYELSDDGYVLDDVRMSGCEIDGDKARDLLRRTLKSYHVDMGADEALLVRATERDFSQRFHSLLQAMLAVDDMFYLSRSTVVSMFFELVQAWLRGGNVRFLEKPKFQGRSHYLQQFDFAIPASNVRPLRIVDAISNPSREKAVNLAFKWHDVREDLEKGAKAYAILNDDDGIRPNVLQALQAYDVQPIRWSQRQDYLEELVA